MFSLIIPLLERDQEGLGFEVDVIFPNAWPLVASAILSVGAPAHILLAELHVPVILVHVPTAWHGGHAAQLQEL